MLIALEIVKNGMQFLNLFCTKTAKGCGKFENRVNKNLKLQKLRRRRAGKKIFKDQNLKKEHQKLEHNMSNIQIIHNQIRELVNRGNNFAKFMNNFPVKNMKTKPIKLLHYNQEKKPKVRIITNEKEDSIRAKRNSLDDKFQLIDSEHLLQKVQGKQEQCSHKEEDNLKSLQKKEKSKKQKLSFKPKQRLSKLLYSRNTKKYRSSKNSLMEMKKGYRIERILSGKERFFKRGASAKPVSKKYAESCIDLKVNNSSSQLRENSSASQKYQSCQSAINNKTNLSYTNFKDLVKDNPMLGYLLPKYKNTKLERPSNEEHNISQPIIGDQRPLSQGGNRVRSGYISRNHSISNPAKSIKDIKSSLTSEVSKKLLNVQVLKPPNDKTESSDSLNRNDCSRSPPRCHFRKMRHRRRVRTKRLTKLAKISRIKKNNKSLLKHAYKEFAIR
ncbi:unnamed protein product [Moneuplotes crassus]|uniref:Uncharacterized protein n=1 Tax=Euplotes crassus TaxID=5936 RepID=A0AAD1XAN9_EUPCR|nr:unnamed protein product [Moneuplotes crassus]